MNRPMVILIRCIHGLITLYFLACIAAIYYSAVTRQPSLWVGLAALSILLEGLVVSLNHGNCPLGSIHHRFGDQKAFFELFLPPRLAKGAVPILGGVSAVGMLLLLYNCS